MVEVRWQWEKGMLVYGQRNVVCALQTETLRKPHKGHQGILGCSLRAKISVWRPGLSNQITSFIKKSPECVRDNTLNKTSHSYHTSGLSLAERLLLTSLTSKERNTWWTTAPINPEIHKLRSTTIQSIVNTLKTVLTRHGIPEILRSEKWASIQLQKLARFASRY